MLGVHYSCMFTYVLKKESGHTGEWNWITASKPQTLYVQKVPKTPFTLASNQPEADLIESICLLSFVLPTNAYLFILKCLPL